MLNREREQEILNILKISKGFVSVKQLCDTLFASESSIRRDLKALEQKGYTNYIMSEVTYIPDNYITLDEETTEKVVSLIEALEDLDDVQNVYHNLEI